jgi:predicted Zn-dependent peptidase
VPNFDSKIDRIHERELAMTRFRISYLCRCLFLGTTLNLFAQTPDRSKPPELGPPPVLKVPPIQHLKLSNGLPVVLVEKNQVPLVDIILQVSAGSGMDPAGKTGLASVTLAMLDEGAGTRNALQIADEIDYLGASLSVGAGYHTSSVSLHVPVARLDAALAVMADVALRPTFPAEELERQRKQRLTALAQAHDNPQTIATVLSNRVLYGEQHPYGQQSGGVESSLRGFAVQDCKDFYAKHFLSNNAALIVSGDVTAKTILPKLESAFGRWKAGKAPSVAWPEVKQVTDRQILLVDKPEAAQSVIRIGRIGAMRMTEDYYAITVLNTILGGSFTSRLNYNLRETHGYSYGAGSSFAMRPQPGPFVASSSVQTDVTDKALTEFIRELSGILGDISDEELTRAKNYEALGYPANFQTTGQIAGALMELVTYGLPDTYFNDYVKNILAVTKEQVQAAAKKYIDPNRLSIVVVGDRAKIEAGVRALNLGEVKAMTIEEVLGKAPRVEGAD